MIARLAPLGIAVVSRRGGNAHVDLLGSFIFTTARNQSVRIDRGWLDSGFEGEREEVGNGDEGARVSAVAI